MNKNLKIVSLLIRKKLWAQIVFAMTLGVILGLILSSMGNVLLLEDHTYLIGSWLKLPGSVFLNLIQMIVTPLVISSIILGICSSGDIDYLKKVGVRIIPYFTFTTIISVLIGLFLTLIIEPGAYINSTLSSIPQNLNNVDNIPVSTQVSIPDKIASLIPTNLTLANAEKDMLQVVVFSFIFGVAITALPNQKTKPLLAMMYSIQEVSLKIVSWSMLIAPYAVFGLIADITIRIGTDAIIGVAAYVGTVILGLLVLLVFYLLVIKFLVNGNILNFISSIKDVQLLAFSTSSSAAVMPLSIETSVEKLKINPAISKFIIPLGATINMDGTALYQVTAAFFLTQVYGIELSNIQILILVLTTVGASIGSPSTPGVGIVILATILQSIGIPSAGLALIIGVDRILDMCRTSVNVTGDLTACCVMNKWLSK